VTTANAFQKAQGFVVAAHHQVLPVVYGVAGYFVPERISAAAKPRTARSNQQNRRR
jgi:hypothetical protein